MDLRKKQRKYRNALDTGAKEERERIIKKIREELLSSGQYPCGFIDGPDNLCERVPREQIEELLKDLEGGEQ